MSTTSTTKILLPTAKNIFQEYVLGKLTNGVSLSSLTREKFIKETGCTKLSPASFRQYKISLQGDYKGGPRLTSEQREKYRDLLGPVVQAASTGAPPAPDGHALYAYIKQELSKDPAVEPRYSGYCAASGQKYTSYHDVEFMTLLASVRKSLLREPKKAAATPVAKDPLKEASVAAVKKALGKLPVVSEISAPVKIRAEAQQVIFSSPDKGLASPEYLRLLAQVLKAIADDSGVTYTLSCAKYPEELVEVRKLVLL